MSDQNKIKISFYERALRNLLILALIPFITAIWMIIYFKIYITSVEMINAYANGLLTDYSLYFVLLAIFIIISVLEFIVLVSIKFESKK